MNVSVLRKSLVVAFVAAAVSLCCFALPAQAHAKTYVGDVSVNLTEDVTDIVIAEGANVTIDLNGHTISASAKSTSADDMHHAIINYGTLAVRGSGTIDGGSFGGTGALYNAPGATATLYGGTFTGTNWYVLKNLGTMVIDGATVDQKSPNNNSAVASGYSSSNGKTDDCYVKPTGNPEPSLTIKSGSISNINSATVKNDDYGHLTISGGTLYNTGNTVIDNHNIAEVSGGTFSVGSNGTVIHNCPCAANSDQGQFTISGGTFTGNIKYTVTKGVDGFLKISGGTFSTDPSKYVVEGKAATKEAAGYVVGDKTADATGEVTTDGVEIDNSTAEKVADTAANAAKALQDDGLTDNTVAGITVDNSAEIAALVSNLEETDSVTVELEVSAESAETDEKIDAAKNENEEAQYFDISIAMVVTVNQGTPDAESATAEVTALPEEIEVTIKVADSATVAGKYVRVARLHDGSVEYLPATVDEEAGTVAFKTSKFSTYAILTSAKVTVTFVVDGATYKTVDTGEGQTVATVDDPTKSGYTFSGWYIDEACKTKFDFSTTLKENTTLYAGFTKNAEPEQPSNPDSGNTGDKGNAGDKDNTGDKGNAGDNANTGDKSSNTSDGTTTTTVTTTTTNNAAKSATPQTGDNANLFALGFVAIAGIVALGAGVVARKRS